MEKLFKTAFEKWDKAATRIFESALKSPLVLEPLGGLYNREQVASFMPVLNSNIEADVDFLAPYFVGQLARPGFEFLRLARQPFGLAAVGD